MPKVIDQDEQLLIDLTQMHGWLSDRFSGSEKFQETIAKATKKLYPKAVLSQAMELTLQEMKE